MHDTPKPSFAELMAELDRAIAKLQESAIELAIVMDAPTESKEVIAKAMGAAA